MQEAEPGVGSPLAVAHLVAVGVCQDDNLHVETVQKGELAMWARITSRQVGTAGRLHFATPPTSTCRQPTHLHRCLAGRFQGDERREHTVAARLHLLLCPVIVTSRAAVSGPAVTQDMID